MAESVARVKVQATADLKGLDDAAKALKSLQQAIAPTDAALSKARLEIIEFGLANKQTEKLIAAQVNALKSLRTEAQIGGQLYEALGKDIDGLKNKLNGTSAATEKAASSFEQLGKAATSIQNSLQKQGQSFSAFKRQAGETGKAVGELAAAFNIKFDRAGKAIEDAARQVEILKKNASNIGSMFQGPQKGGGLFEIPRKGLADIQAFSQLVKRLKEQSESAYGKVARISEGLFAVGASGAVVGQVANAFGGVSNAIEAASGFAARFSGTLAGMGSGIQSGIGLGALKSGLNEISLLLNQPANGLANLSQSLGKVQQSLDLLNVPAEAFNNALAALGPTGAAAAGVVALALAKVSEEKRKFLKDFEKEATEGLRGITDETQRLINKLAQLSEAFRSAASMNELQALRAGGAARFNETPAGTDASRRAANTIASAEARIKAEAMAQAEVLETARQRYRGTTESVDALSERLAYLQQAMKYVDQSTAEGKAEFAAFSNEANKVKGQIDALSNSYRTVADAIRDAARAQGEYANQSTVNNYLNRAATRQQEELAAAARTALSQPRTPLLPAAGQTSFAGTYGPGGIGGGARMGTGRGETPFIIGTENVGVGTAVYRGAQRTEMEIAGAAAALERDMRTAAAAVNNADKAVGELKQAFSELIQPIEKVAKSDFFSPNSINALKARREQIDRERNAVDMLGEEYQRLSRELARVDKQIERTQPGGLRGKIGYIGQGIGAAASAGIFGGPEGAIGGLLGGGVGALLGGPAGFAAGSFIGSSGGAYAGMARQQLGQFTTYAADISKLEIALKGVTKTQGEYQRALAASASVTRDFNVPQLEATKSMTQLSAAVIGAGGKVADAEVVFRNVTAAIKASGGTSEDVQGALTALGQIFSKGKVSAEELQGQLGERLPGAVTMFAQATGRTLPQLQKDLEQGVVGLADLMKFVVSDQGLGQFEQQAKTIADSSAEAGARLTTTWNDTKRAIGEALLPLGAQIQDSLAKALREATPALVEFAKGTATFIKALVDSAGVITNTITTVGKFALVFTGASLAVKGFAVVLPLASQGLALLGAAFGTTTAQAVVAQNRLIAFGGTVKTLARAVAAPLVITIAIVGAQLVIDYFNRIKAARDKLVNVVSEATGAEWLKDIGGDALTRDRLTKAVDEVGKAYQEAADKANKLRKERDLLNEMAATSPSATILSATRLQAVEAQLKLAEAQVKLLETRYKAGIARLPDAPKAGATPGLTDFSLAAGEKDPNQKAITDAERVAAQQQQLNESVAKARIALSDAQFSHDQELARKRYEYEIELDRKRRDNWVKMQTGAARSAAGMVSGFFGEVDALLDKLRQGKEQVEAAAQKSQSAAAMAAVTVSPAPIATAAGGNAMGLSQGAAVPGPPAALWNGGRGVSLPSGAAAATRRDVSAEGSAAVAAADLAAAEEALKLVEGQFGNLLELLSKSFVLDFTDQIRQQNAALRDSAEITGLRNKLELEGQRPELIESEVKKAEAIQRVAQENATNTNELIKAKAILDQLQSAKEKDIYAIEAQKTKIDTLSNAISGNNDNLQEFIRLTNEATSAQIAFNDALRFRQDDRVGMGLREGAQQYVQSIGTMREATSQLAQTGIKGVEDAILSLVTTGAANFQEFAAKILEQTAQMIIQQLILRSIMQIIGAIPGGGGGGGDAIANFNAAAATYNANGNAFGKNGIMPFAMGGIVTKPTLFRYANGGVPGTGLMGEAGPEAIIPLRRGRDGKLGVAGGGGSTSVTVNVDASGSSVQGNSGQGEQLGRAISQAVQQELIKQRRPGGLLAA